MNNLDPPTLLAIAIAARLSGDRDLERAARRLLREGHGVQVFFGRAKTGQAAVISASGQEVLHVR